MTAERHSQIWDQTMPAFHQQKGTLSLSASTNRRDDICSAHRMLVQLRSMKRCESNAKHHSVLGLVLVYARSTE